MKTIKEWFESVENLILRKVLLMRYDSNYDVHSDGEYSLKASITYGFDWNKTVEGYKFWIDVTNELKSSNESPTFNAKYPVMQVEWLDENECIHCETVVEKSQIESLLSNRISYVITGSPDSERCYIILNPKFPAVYLFRPETYTIYPAKLFIKQQKQINMKQSLTLGQLKDLVNADSCTEWKTRLFNILKSYYSYKDDTVFEICQEDIDYAKQRCSPKQLQLLKDAGLVFEEECPYKVGDWIININPEIEEDRIAYKIKHITDNCYLLETNIPHKHFDIKYDGLRKATQEEIDYASIDWDKLKTGSVVMLNVNLCDGDIDKPFNIVLINTNFTITNEKGDYDCGKKRFVKWSDIDGSSSAKKDLITFYQNNKFFVVGQDNIKDLITKVISY